MLAKEMVELPGLLDRSGAAFTITVRGYSDVAAIAEKDKALAKLAAF